MATIEQPSPALYSAVLHILGNTDSRSRSMSVTMSDLIEHLTAEQAACLPHAFGQVLPLLSKDPERLQFAAHLAVRFDFYEVAAELAKIALAQGDRELKLAAASLCGNPAVEGSVRQRVAEAVADDPYGRIRLDSSAVPGTEDEIRLYSQCWPGVRTESEPLLQTPVAVLDWSFPADAALRLAVQLDKAGASVRRLSPEVEIPHWFGAQTVLVCQAPTRIRVLNSYPGFPERRILVEAMPSNSRESDKLLRIVNGALTGPHRLSLAAFGPEVEHAVYAPDVFTAGVYSTRDAAFLSGTTSSSLNRLRTRGILHPRNAGTYLWTFRDVVAVRTWMYLKLRSQRRVSSNVVEALARFAGDSTAVRLGATSGGKVLVDQGDGWDDVESGQRVMGIPITDIDEVFRPFEYGGGTTLDLLQANDNTELHPTILSGTYHLSGHRISAKALASVDTLCRREVIEAAYPELEGKSFEDTVSVGRQLLSAI